MATKKKTLRKPMLNAAQKRNLIYIWLYVTASKAAAIAQGKTTAAQIVAELGSVGVIADPAIVSRYMTNVKAMGNTYTQTVSLMQLQDPDWSGTGDHPGTDDLNTLVPAQ